MRSLLWSVAFVLVPSAAAQDELAARLRDYLRRAEPFGFAGSVLVAVKGKVVLAEGFGLADRAQGVRNQRDTLFEIASATKPFTAIAILRLEADGKLSRTDPIGKHLPGVPQAARGITIDHLLAHTSGMPRMAAGGHGDDLERAVADYLATPPARAPGERHEYWNGGYALLAGIVERVAGVPYARFVRERVLAPAGMASSGFTGDEFPVGKIAIGYEGEEPPRRADEHPYGSYGWQYRGMGGLVTSVDDLWRFDRALGGDKLLPAAQRADLSAQTSEYYGRGFAIVAKPRKMVGHGGDVRGFHCQFFRFPDDDGCIAVLGNTGGVLTWAILENLKAIAFGDPSRYPEPPAAVAWPEARLASLAGRFAKDANEAIDVEVEGGIITLRARGAQTTKLFASSPFGKPEEPRAELLTVARSIVEALAAGHAEPLRKRMADGIPESWPERVLATYWPEHVARHGAVQSIGVQAALAQHGTTTVLLALAHKTGTSHVKIMFVGDRLQILDLNGPAALASCTAVPGAGTLLRFAWPGTLPPPLAVECGDGKSVTALRLEGAKYRRSAR